MRYPSVTPASTYSVGWVAMCYMESAWYSELELIRLIELNVITCFLVEQFSPSNTTPFTSLDNRQAAISSLKILRFPSPHQVPFQSSFQ